MQLVVVHLSDIHLRTKKNPVMDRIEQIASAVISVGPTPDMYLVILSGDIAFSGEPAEYDVAAAFLEGLREKLSRAAPSSELVFLSVPGNHDAVLPADEMSVREALVRGVLSSINGPRIDPGLLRKLLEAQGPYNDFRTKHFGRGEPWDGVCETMLLERLGKRIQVNLYNTAILSQREEKQGQLRVPVRRISESIHLASNVALSISVFHHSYGWLESNNHLDFRNHIERVSDIALTGHQHFAHNFYKVNSTGEQVLYLEGGALQDEGYAHQSELTVILFDLSRNEESSVHFKWARDLYARSREIAWRPISLNRNIRLDFVVTEEFDRVLNDPGTPCFHKIKGALGLRDFFVYPDFSVTKAGSKGASVDVKGDEILKHISSSRRMLFQGSALVGKTALAKRLFHDVFGPGQFVPLFLDGKTIKTATSRKLTDLVGESADAEYGPANMEAFRQLPPERKVLIVDDWHRASLNAEGRRQFLQFVDAHFGKVILFCDDVFRLQELTDKLSKTLVDFDHVTIREAGHLKRGSIIDRWLTMGREHTVGTPALAHEIEETERFVQSVIGKNTLPSLPFIVLAILQIREEDKAESPEAGSFGYLYEVLVTRALSATTGRKAQLEKKYTFLARLAYRLFKLDVESVPVQMVREIADEYAHSHLVQVDVDSLLADLERERVLVNIEGNYSFGYPHFYYYFVARYYKEHLDRGDGERLRTEIARMVDLVSSEKYATILMFVIYLARDSAGVIDKLVANAKLIYATEPPAGLASEVSFLEDLCGAEETDLPTRVDIEKNREHRRKSRDLAERRQNISEKERRAEFQYSEDLSDVDKIRLSFRHIDLLGHVIRNFPGSLPGKEKLAILSATYMLALRLLGKLFGILESIVEEAYQNSLKGPDPETRADQQALASKSEEESIYELIGDLGRFFAIAMTLRVASSVGLPELEEAYSRVLEEVGRTNATRLIDLAIKLEHSKVYPEYEIKELHRDFAKNYFADRTLKSLVIGNIRKYGMDQRLRQRIAAALQLRANAPLLLEATARKKYSE